MFRTLRSFLGLGSKKPVQPKAGKFFRNMRLKLEALEDRTVPVGDIGSFSQSPLNINPGGNLGFDISSATGTPGIDWDVNNLFNTADGYINFNSQGGATSASQYNITIFTRALDGTTPAPMANFNPNASV